jgi:hypothetical protein
MGKSSKDKGQAANKRAKAKRKADELLEASDEDSTLGKLRELHAEQTKLAAKIAELSTAAIKRAKTSHRVVSPGRPTATHRTVLREVTEYVKIYFYRNYKFIKSDEELNWACEHIWNELHAANHWTDAPYYLDLASFTHLYGPTIKTVVSGARQYSQSKGKNAASGKYFCCLLRLTGCLLCLTGRVNPKPVHSHLAPASTIFQIEVFASGRSYL